MQVTQIFYLHEIGSKKNQEDYLWPVPGTASAEDHIFIVCDGVGGSDSGEVASRIVAESVGTSLLRTPNGEVGLELVDSLLEGARRKLVEYGVAKGLGSDMATTFTLLELIGDRAFIAWVGDSRVYHVRGNEILFRTEDHSLVYSLIRSGELSEEEAHNHPQKNLLLKAVRADDTEPAADGHWVEDIRDGDYFMLCTDGLLENITEPDLLFLLRQNDEGAIDIVKAFQQFCFEKTRDNYSMYLVKVGAADTAGAAGSAGRAAGAGEVVEAVAAVEPLEAPVEPVARKKSRKLIWLMVLLLVMIAAAAFFIKENYYSPAKPIEVLVPVTRSRDSSDLHDSLVKAAAVGDSTAEVGQAAKRKDSLAALAKSHIPAIVPKTLKDSTQKKNIKPTEKSPAADSVVQPVQP